MGKLSSGKVVIIMEFVLLLFNTFNLTSVPISARCDKGKVKTLLCQHQVIHAVKGAKTNRFIIILSQIKPSLLCSYNAFLPPIAGNIQHGTSLLWFSMLPLELTLQQNNTLGESNLFFPSL